MHEPIKTQWVADLRSGEYKQGQGALHVEETDRFCCLGVLCDQAVKAGVEVVAGRHESATGEFLTTYDGVWAVLPQSVMKWAGLDSTNPDVVPVHKTRSLAELNDDGQTFERIADLIEQQL